MAGCISDSTFFCTDEAKEQHVRDQYKDLINQTMQSALQDDKILDQTLDRADVVFREVSKPREAVYDSTLVKLQSEILKQKTRSLNTNLTVFKLDEYITRLKFSAEHRKLCPVKNPTPLTFWSVLGKYSRPAINAAASYSFLYGTFESGPVELKEKYRKNRNKDELSSVAQRPKVIDAKDAQRTKQATREAEKILSILTRLCQEFGGPICYFEFVTNPDSFSETVENMYYVSMLVQEASVRILKDNRDLPVIEPIVPQSKVAETKLYGKYNQCILSISEPEWKDVVRVFKITKPKIPTRGKTE